MSVCGRGKLPSTSIIFFCIQRPISPGRLPAQSLASHIIPPSFTTHPISENFYFN